MTDWTWQVIGCIWLAWLIYWLVMAFRTKPTVERGGFVGYRLVALGLAVVLIAAGHIIHISPQSRLWQTTVAVGAITDCMVLGGAAFTVWARITLGRNWSAEVTFKQDHELIESGPYALARHPIYTGLIVMALGTAINYGRAIGFVIFFAICGAVWLKARQEEQIMSRHFPDAYPAYKQRVHALIPFVL
ncbi:MAG: isoprenylcysteine carboxylmethyltransferase family protein [Solirubrobacterales bacterium]